MDQNDPENKKNTKRKPASGKQEGQPLKIPSGTEKIGEIDLPKSKYARWRQTSHVIGRL
jgi:hypothetical protein